MIALPHLLVGLRRRTWENLFFVLAALSVAGIAWIELTMMHARTVERIGHAQQWVHLPVFFLVIAVTGFVYFYFGTARAWLGIAAILTRLVSLAINFASPPNVNFREITGLRHREFLGDTVAMPEGIISPWTHVSELSSLLALIFVVDASLTLWRRGSAQDRRRALFVGGSITLFIVLAAGMSSLTHAGLLHAPYLVSLPFLGVVMAMGCELSYDILHAAETARRLQASEAALRESDSQMSLAASAANLALWVWNIQKDDLWITEKGRALFGFAEGERISFRRFLQCVHEEDRPHIENLVDHARARGGDFESEYRIVQPDGRTRWIAGYGRVEFDEHGKPSCLRGVTRDITERQVAEEALRESEGRFRTVADIAPVMIWMSGTDKEGVFFNKRWLEFTGRTVDQEMGEGWLKGVHPDDLANCLGVCGNAFKNREPFTVEFRLRRRDGEYRWLMDTGTPRFDPGGSFLGYVGSCVDIADRRQAEMDHQLQSTELARVGRLALMGELAASLAHEVNNPLGAMVTNASAGQRLLARGELNPDDLRELLADIVADGHRARDVIQSVRNMVRKSESSHSPIAMKEVIEDLLRMTRADALAKKVSVVAEVDPNVGVVMGDRVQLLQVLLNLTMNAFEALGVVRADSRRVVIGAARDEDGKVRVSVRDNGPGFPTGIVDQFFEPFFSTKTEGTGMGLAIARGIIEAHGGTLSGGNYPEGGALFTVSLPQAPEAKSPAVESAAAASRT